VYKGHWKDDLRHGQGVLERDYKYDGMFEADKFHGEGTITYKNGDTETGPWVNGARHGDFLIVKAGKNKKKETKYRYNKGNFVFEVK